MVGLASGRRKVASDRLADPERHKRLGLFDRRRHLIDDRNWDAVTNARGKTSKRRAGEDHDVRFELERRLSREFGEEAFLLVLHVADGLEGIVEHADAGASSGQPVHVDAFLVPGAERSRECDDGEAPPQHASREHRRFGHADNRNIEQLARPEETRIAERGDDGGVVVLVAIREHLEGNRAADLSLGARRDIGNAPRRSGGREDCPSRRGLLRGGGEPGGDIRRWCSD